MLNMCPHARRTPPKEGPAVLRSRVLSCKERPMERGLQVLMITNLMVMIIKLYLLTVENVGEKKSVSSRKLKSPS